MTSSRNRKVSSQYTSAKNNAGTLHSAKSNLNCSAMLPKRHPQSANKQSLAHILNEIDRIKNSLQSFSGTAKYQKNDHNCKEKGGNSKKMSKVVPKYRNEKCPPNAAKCFRQRNGKMKSKENNVSAYFSSDPKEEAKKCCWQNQAFLELKQLIEDKEKQVQNLRIEKLEAINRNLINENQRLESKIQFERTQRYRLQEQYRSVQLHKMSQPKQNKVSQYLQTDRYSSLKLSAITNQLHLNKLSQKLQAQNQNQKYDKENRYQILKSVQNSSRHKSRHRNTAQICHSQNKSAIMKKEEGKEDSWLLDLSDPSYDVTINQLEHQFAELLKMGQQESDQFKKKEIRKELSAIAEEIQQYKQAS